MILSSQSSGEGRLREIQKEEDEVDLAKTLTNRVMFSS